ncbi:MAG: alkaline phosphatase family protein [Chloroherpetonaceae bacterium]|nr:alkaline phosphatase family protein [Chloroherpetonaceae bacterium]
MIFKYFILFITFFTIFQVSGYSQKKQKPKKSEVIRYPKLIVSITVDQLRGDYLDRYAKFFIEPSSPKSKDPDKAGFKRFMNKGAWFKSTHYPFIATLTAVGHQSIYSGVFPSKHGIIGNDWFDVNSAKQVYCVSDSTVSGVEIDSKKNQGKMSPKNAQVENVFSYLKAERPKSRVIGIALKNRAAILPAGKQANAAFWFDDETGKWVSSTYYFKDAKSPQWLKSFNARKIPESHFNSKWEPLLRDEDYFDADFGEGEGVIPGDDSEIFPHVLRDLSTLKDPRLRGNKRFDAFAFFPIGNTFTKDFAKVVIEEESLGQRDHTDVLAISFSSLDICGHTFGPNSREIQDMMIRLDKDLSDLFQFLDETIGRGRYLATLSSDHGVAPLPEQNYSKWRGGERLNQKDFEDSLKLRVHKEFPNVILEVMNNDVYLNHKVITSQKYDLKKVIDAVKKGLLQFAYIKEAYSRDEINEPNLLQTGTDSSRFFIKNALYPSRSGDVFFVLKPFSFFKGQTGTTHGTLQKYDRFVPMAFYGFGVKPKKHLFDTTPLDLAATIHKILALKKKVGYDGADLSLALIDKYKPPKSKAPPKKKKKQP